MEGRKCNGQGCQEEAKLQCPSCLKLNREEVLPYSYFCSQTCFKSNWALHKVLHVVPNETPVSEKNIYPSYKYTGPLRAWPKTAKRSVPAHIQKPDYAETGDPVSERMERGTFKILNEEQIAKMRTVCKMGREILNAAGSAVKEGVTTDDLDRIVHDETIKRNAYPSPLNYMGFPKSCCTSVNEVICHGIPDTRPLKKGEIVNIDVSVYYDGFHADLNETYLVGGEEGVDEKGRRLVSTARECLEKAIQFCKPGCQYREIGDVIEKHAKANGFSVVRTYCGHGINTLFHCAPNVPHYARNKAIGTLKPGHCFTIEPMINEGTWHDVTWPDNWTAATADGKRSAQFEHTLLVTKEGVEILTANF